MTDVVTAPLLMLDRSRPLPVGRPELDEDQQRVVAHVEQQRVVCAERDVHAPPEELVEGAVLHLPEQEIVAER